MNNPKAILGQTIEDFELMDSEGRVHRLSQFCGKPIVLVFWSAECPLSEQYDAFFNGLMDRNCDGQIVVWGVDSNANYGQNEIATAVAERGVRFPILRDADGAMADYFGALTTPHVFIVDAETRLVYAGAVDDRTFRQPEARVQYVDQALAALQKGETPPVAQTPPYGCTIVRY